MKPKSQFGEQRFPQADYFFQAHGGRWHGWYDEEPFRRRRNLGREYLIEAARERTKEMAILGVLLLASAWPIISVIVEITRFYYTHHR